MSLKRWHLIEDITLPLAVWILRFCWLWPWLELVRRWISPQAYGSYLPLVGMAVLGIGGYVAAHQVLSGTEVSRLARSAVIGLGLLTLVVILWLHYVAGLFAPWDAQGYVYLGQQATNWTFGPPPAFLAFVIGAQLWIQGVRDAAPLSRHEQVWSTFTVGFVAFAFMLLVVQLDDRGLPPGTGAAIWTFFGVGMAALALSALEYAGIGQDKDAEVPGMSRYWLGSMLAVVGGIMGIGLLLILVLAPDTLAAVFGRLRFLLDWLGTILGYVLLAVAYVTFLLVEPLYNWLRNNMQLREMEEDTVDTQSMDNMLENYMTEPTSVLPEAVADSLPWLALLVIAVGLALAVVAALRILRRSSQESYIETRESVFSTDLLQDQLSSLWQRLTGRGGTPVADPFFSLENEEARRRTIRAIYQEFLAHMQALGQPRAPHLTPTGYGAYLATVPALGSSTGAGVNGVNDEKDGYAGAVETLTRGYIQARYGDNPPTADEVAAVERAWQQLRARVQPAPSTPSNDSQTDSLPDKPTDKPTDKPSE
ncbi:MAG: DUF4129 domain-containing protein [Litorilinea sp.]